ncbi:hypothetical protein OUZ56_001676 [Daphnia magna]|uniref:Uncharacterized protein n=1 Tax=Daphnia magna TaxID=35525 RepID=A0ABR0A3D8_9CRUS|nr:hypothetical protein OUZ56_001676 [Daphnia magna]
MKGQVHFGRVPYLVIYNAPVSTSKYAKMKTEQESENQSDDEQNETGFLGITLKKQRYYVLG